jgi:hypothetical protein
MANEAWRDGRGRFHIRCDACSSTGTCHAETNSTGVGSEAVETLPFCPWCKAPMNIIVKLLPEDRNHPDWS